MTVHLFGKADSPCIAAWALQQTAADKEAAFGEEIHKIVQKNFYVAEISVSPGDRRKSPSSRPWRAGYSDPNKKIFILEDGKIHCVNFSLQAQ